MSWSCVTSRCVVVYGRCTDSVSRVAAYELLLELADGCVDNMQEMCRDLVAMHHQAHVDADHQWEVCEVLSHP